ncbi:hypothetical protein [Bradyrhizobium sp. B120]|uniref:hypothetical protein n=1 Tax=Bradyrhizobium sp. B120 TaxID=3410088 RepID=UPI003B984476
MIGIQQTAWIHAGSVHVRGFTGASQFECYAAGILTIIFADEFHGEAFDGHRNGVCCSGNAAGPAERVCSAAYEADAWRSHSVTPWTAPDKHSG